MSLFGVYSRLKSQQQLSKTTTQNTLLLLLQQIVLNFKLLLHPLSILREEQFPSDVAFVSTICVEKKVIVDLNPMW